jgi:hypothetical protein
MIGLGVSELREREMWSDRPTRREADRRTDRPGMVRLLSNEPTETERYGHAFELLALIARAEAREQRA